MAAPVDRACRESLVVLKGIARFALAHATPSLITFTRSISHHPLPKLALCPNLEATRSPVSAFGGVDALEIADSSPGYEAQDRFWWQNGSSGNGLEYTELLAVDAT